jgi:SRSO17 transposase
LWSYVKKTVREIEEPEAAIAMDDSIAEKAYTDENELITWHYHHSKGRCVKGLNILGALYCSKGICVPLGYELVRKTAWAKDKTSGKEKRVSERTKNEMYRDVLRQAARNEVKFKWVLNDVWYGSADNMVFVKHDLGKEFIVPLKTNRKVALILADKQRGCIWSAAI